MNQLTKISTAGLEPAYSLLAKVRAENLWLANFTSENTQAGYKRAVGEFILFNGIVTPDELYKASQAHVIAWRVDMKARGWSNATIAARLSAVSSLYKFLADRQLAMANPVSGVLRPKTGGNGMGSGKTPALTRSQVRAMLDAPDTSTLKGLRDRAILHVFFFTGGRCSEPAKLKVRDFRPDADYWVLEMMTKGEKTNTIAIHIECQAAIRRYLEASGHGEDRTSPLFQAVKSGNNCGQPLSRNQFFTLFKEYAQKVGLPPEITPHSARATFITHAYEAGWSGEDIQTTVGHSSITTTEGYNRQARKHRKSASFAMNF